MNRIAAILIHICINMFFLLVIFSCRKASEPLATNLSFEEATQIILEEVQHTRTLYASRSIVPENTRIFLGSDSTTFLDLIEDSWYFVLSPGYPYVNSSNKHYFVGKGSGEIIAEFRKSGKLVPTELDTLIPSSTTSLTLEDAVKYVEADFAWRFSPPAIFAGRTPFPGGTSIITSDGNSYTIKSTSWLFLMDHNYITSDWPRLAFLIAIEKKSGFIRYNFINYPPANLADLDTLSYPYQRINETLPEFAFSDTTSDRRGCCRGIFYQQNSASNALLVLQTNFETLGLTTEFTNFDVSNLPANMELYLNHYYYIPHRYVDLIPLLCSDTGSRLLGFKEPRKWFPVSGLLRIRRIDSNDGYFRIEMQFIDTTWRNEELNKEFFIPVHNIEDTFMDYCEG